MSFPLRASAPLREKKRRALQVEVIIGSWTFRARHPRVVNPLHEPVFASLLRGKPVFPLALALTLTLALILKVQGPFARALASSTSPLSMNRDLLARDTSSSVALCGSL